MQRSGKRLGRGLLGAVALGAALAAATPRSVSGQNAAPVRILVPFAAGGSTEGRPLIAAEWTAVGGGSSQIVAVVGVSEGD